MKQRNLLLVCIATVALAVFFDLGKWMTVEADRHFRNGDMPRAIARWNSTLRIHTDDRLTAYNRGVAYYRMGNYSAAVINFKSALRSNHAPLRQKSLYNLGTIQLQRSISGASKNTHTVQLLSDATEHLGESARINPNDADASHNYKVAQAMLASLRTAAPRKQRPTEPRNESSEQEKAGTKNSSKGASSSKSSGRPGELTQASNDGTKRRHEAITRNQALRMLNDARGRETLRSWVAQDQQNPLPPPPEKDW